jgi:hypothetical protein
MSLSCVWGMRSLLRFKGQGMKNRAIVEVAVATRKMPSRYSVLCGAVSDAVDAVRSPIAQFRLSEMAHIRPATLTPVRMRNTIWYDPVASNTKPARTGPEAAPNVETKVTIPKSSP